MPRPTGGNEGLPVLAAGTVEPMAASTLAPPIRIARAAVFAVFGLTGFLGAMWVVHIPAVTERTGVSNATLGMLILLMAISAIVGMQAAGPLADRFGSRALVAAAAGWLSLAVIGPGVATGSVSLAVALALFGFGNGALDVSMNVQAVHVEREYPRPIMGAFHALFSCGGLLGSLAGAAALHSGWDLRLTLAIAGIIGILTLAVWVPKMLPPNAPHSNDRTPAFPPTPADGPALSAPATARKNAAHKASTQQAAHTPSAASTSTHPKDHPQATNRNLPAHKPPAHGAPQAQDSPAPNGKVEHNLPTDAATRTAPDGDSAAPNGKATQHLPTTATPPANDTAQNDESPAPNGKAGRRSVQRKVIALAAISFAFLMTEGVANDWSALQVREHLGASEATAALAFAAFSTTMTIGRFAADRVSGRFGPVVVVRWGALLAAAGLALIIGSAWVPLTLAGWALMGIGLAGGVPQIFTAAGNLGTETAATDMSRVFGLGYLGFLAGPSVIGWLSKPTSLTVALIFPLALVLMCAWFARIVRSDS
ncbi:MFS transporter [Nocardia pseudobrasiliensis]|uniref:MFS transporter n=2 Tax=Nocardia pseudobrasiliensis TaxID=45979 RepID=A0A370I4H9_9NOCA|nr:MFS transporter [Nocardia pseudobrasiliensis]